MNSLETDEYWNESKQSKFNFELDDNKSGDVFLLEDAVESSRNSNTGHESLLFSSFNPTKNFESESVSNYLSERCINCILQSEVDTDDSILSQNIPLDEEVRLLRRKIKERWTVPDCESTIKKILLGLPYSLELYRSLSDKKELLSCAVNSADGNAILAVTVNLSKTLKTNLFHQLLVDFPVATSHFVHYLYTRRQMQELSDILEILGRNKEVVMKYLTVASQNPHRLVQRLKLLQKNPSLEPWDAQIINNYSQLAEWQVTVSKITGNQTIIGESAVESLKFSCVNNIRIPFSDFITKSESQQNYLAKCLGIHEKQTTITLIRANAELQKWDKIEELLVRKNWVGGKKLNVNLPIEKILEELQKYGAIGSLLDDVLVLLDLDKRTEIGKSLGRHTIVIEAFGKKRDKAGLLQYMADLDPKSSDYIFAETILQTMDGIL